ncbi:hypothetical protein OHB12_12015 [Nocardia sp. NBC_01730]|uniref:hypothetical protein n=1 Tax=Nocardia sp. NBC_01730 TaxID=2975998 RepID=UPI002E10DF8A|nr:hypothetical protein OHB12_12015 [Nocardia sp. NBC_01730]
MRDLRTPQPQSPKETVAVLGTEPVLTAATAREVLTQQCRVPPELWAHAAALLSAGLDDD